MDQLLVTITDGASDFSCFGSQTSLLDGANFVHDNHLV